MRIGRLVLLLLLLIATPAPAMRQFTVRDGLSQNNVLAIARDERGFVWFGTEDGLTRFDGQEFRVYRQDSKLGSGPSSNDVSALFAEGEYLWIGTRRGRLDRLDLRHQRWQSFAPLRDKSDQNTAAIAVILRAANGELFIGTDGNGLYRLRADGTVIRSYTTSTEGTGLPSNRVYSLSLGPSGLWIGTRDGVVNLDLTSDTLRHYTIGGLDPFAQNADEVLEEPDGSLWIGTWEAGLFRVNAARTQFRRFVPTAADGAGLRSSRVISLERDSDGRMWFGSGAGVAYFEQACDCIRALPLDLPGRDNQRPIYVIRTLSDGQGGLWAGTWGEGVLRIPANAARITRERAQSTRPDGLTGARVRALVLDHRGDLWVGSFGSGLQRAGPTQRSRGLPWSFQAPAQPARPGVERAGNIWSMIEDRAGRLWVGTEAGLDRLDANRSAWTLFNMAPSPGSAPPAARPAAAAAVIPSGAVRALLEARDGRIFVGTSAGLVTVNAKDSIQAIRDPISRSGMVTRLRVLSLAEDSLGRIWIGTSEGLHVLSAQGEWLPHAAPHAALPDGAIYALRFRDDGSVWAAGGFGLCRSAQTQALEQLAWHCLSETDGLAAGIVYSIQPGSDGTLWLGTGHGLARLSPSAIVPDKQAAVWMYLESDGLVGDEYLPNAHALGPDGELYFGSESGLVSFKPSELRPPPGDRTLLITEIEINNRPLLPNQPDATGRLRLSEAPAYLRELRLLHSDRQFAARLSALEFDRPGSIQYAYRLLGFDPDWSSGGNRALLSYTNVPPGEYRLQARIRDGLRPWGAPRELLRISIAPPYWATWWFRSVLVLLSLLLLGLVFRWRTANLQARQRELEIKVAERTRELAASAEALRDANLRLFEFSTRDPLTNLYNRRHVHDLLARLLLAPMRLEPGKLSLAMVDADYFKRINDQYGHAVGDLVLRALAEVLQRNSGEKDIVGRYGGEEFICALVDHPAPSALRWSEKVREQIAAFHIDAGAEQVQVTISIGLANYVAGMSVEEWIANADKALYLAKHQGRNRVVVYSSGAD